MKWLISLCFSFFSHLNEGGIKQPEVIQKPIVVVIPSYKNQDWYRKNIHSVLNQKYDNFRVIYINDCSPDKTGELVERCLLEQEISHRVICFKESLDSDIETRTKRFIDEVNSQKKSFILVNNVHRCGALENLYRAIQSCSDEEIVVTLDGDDWLFDKTVLTKINQAYQSPNVWLTHGNMIEYPMDWIGWCEPVPGKIITSNAFREFKCPSHLRTFYAWLFKKIKLEDLLYEGKFFTMTWDMAMMYPMVEMAGDRHAFIQDITYVYNIGNVINDNKVNPQLQRDLDYLIRHKERYLPLAYPGNSKTELERGD